jgi:hypothetical protein
MVCHYDVERGVVERDLVYIKVMISPGRIKVSSDVLKVLQSAEPLDETVLRCHVQHLRLMGEEISAFLHVNPKRPMAF